MRCEEIQEQFVDLLYQESGTPEAGPDLLAHLRSCARCREQLADLKGLQSVLRTWQDEPPLRPVRIPQREPARFHLRFPVWSYARYAALAAVVVLAFLALTNAEIRWDKNGFDFRTSLLSRPAPAQQASSDYVNREEFREIMERYAAHSKEMNYQMIQDALNYVDEMRSMDITYIKGKLKESHTKN